jgi:hypothetical protein
MNNTESSKLKGVYEIVVHDRFGNLKDYEVKENLITNAGFKGLAQAAGSLASQKPFHYVAMGTSTTAAAATQTALVAQITGAGLSAVHGTATTDTTTVASDTLKITHQFTATNTKAVNEVGIFDTVSGTMLSRTVLGATKNLTSGDTITVTYKLKFASA